MKSISLLLLFAFSITVVAQQKLPLIPKPQTIEYQLGFFELNSKTTIQTTDINSFEALFLKENIKAQTGLDLKIISEATSKNVIQLGIQSSKSKNYNKEHYELSIVKNNIQITAFANQGLFYGVQTLLQNIPYENAKKIQLETD